MLVRIFPALTGRFISFQGQLFLKRYKNMRTSVHDGSCSMNLLSSALVGVTKRYFDAGACRGRGWTVSRAEMDLRNGLFTKIGFFRKRRAAVSDEPRSDSAFHSSRISSHTAPAHPQRNTSIQACSKDQYSKVSHTEVSLLP